MQTLYIYRSHIGDAYWIDRPLTDAELVCSVCGGIDEYVGQASSLDEFVAIINNANVKASNLMVKNAEQTFEDLLRFSFKDGIIQLSSVNET